MTIIHILKIVMEVEGCRKNRVLKHNLNVQIMFHKLLTHLFIYFKSIHFCKFGK